MATPRSWQKELKNADVAILGVISVVAIVISVLDSFKLLDNVPFLKGLDYAGLAVLILALIGLHLVLKHVTETEFHERFPLEVDKIISSLNGVHIEVFASAAQMESYLAKRILEAEREVCDLSWKEKLSHVYSTKPRASSHASYENSIEEACERIGYREVFVFSDVRRKEKLERRLAANKPGYSCRYFAGNSIPRIQFVMIDAEEVVFASSAYPKLCAVRHAALAKVFQAYYDEVWNAAIRIKDGNVIHQKEVDKIFKKKP